MSLLVETVHRLFADEQHQQQRARLVEVIHFLHAQGWAPATSSNYSIRASPELVCISRSGIDKGTFSTDHLMYVDYRGQVVWPEGAVPSAETGLHTVVYRMDDSIQCVLHTHSVANTVVSLRYANARRLNLQGYELQKALPRQTTHEDNLVIPVFQNTQNIPTLARQMEQTWNNMHVMHAYLIAGHGLYSWGESIDATKRQIEALEFLFECQERLDLHQALLA